LTLNDSAIDCTVRLFD